MKTSTFFWKHALHGIDAFVENEEMMQTNFDLAKSRFICFDTLKIDAMSLSPLFSSNEAPGIPFVVAKLFIATDMAKSANCFVYFRASLRASLNGEFWFEFLFHKLV